MTTDADDLGWVFLSYRREDVAVARDIRQALRAEGVDVWWDEELQGGERWERRIDEVLMRVDTVIVLWSTASRTSDWVRHEASIGKSRDVLVHARLDDTEVPAPFRSVQTIDLSDWNRIETDAAFQRLLRAVRATRSRNTRRKTNKLMTFAAVFLALGGISFLGGWNYAQAGGEQTGPVATASLEMNNLMTAFSLKGEFGGTIERHRDTVSVALDFVRLSYPEANMAEETVQTVRQLKVGLAAPFEDSWRLIAVGDSMRIEERVAVGTQVRLPALASSIAIPADVDLAETWIAIEIHTDVGYTPVESPPLGSLCDRFVS